MMKMKKIIGTYYDEEIDEQLSAEYEREYIDGYNDKIERQVYKMREINTYSLFPKYANVKSFYHKATVIEEGDTITLISYTTPVCIIEKGKIKLHDTYSNTTMRHIREFLKQNEDKVQEKYPALIASGYSSKEIYKIIQEEDQNTKTTCQLDRLSFLFS